MFIAIQLLIQSSINTVIVGFFPPGPAVELEAALGLTLPVSGAVAGGLFAGSVVLTSVYFVILARELTRPPEALASFSADLHTRRIGRATLAMLVVGAVVWAFVFVGSLFLLLPGIFLVVCFLFVVFAVGVEDRGPVVALKRSWALSRGHRLKLAVLVILAGGIGIAIGIVGTIFDLTGPVLVGELVTNILSSILFVVLYGILAAAYLQVRDGDTGNSTSR